MKHVKQVRDGGEGRRLDLDVELDAADQEPVGGPSKPTVTINSSSLSNGTGY